MFKFDAGKIGLFLGGVAFGTAGIRALSTDEAKECYTKATAAALRAKDLVMDKAQTIQENAEDIYSEAQKINEEKKQEKAAQAI